MDEKETQQEESTLSEDMAQANERRIYEFGYHFIPTLSEKEVEEKALEIKKLVEQHGGIFIAEELPKSFRLAYTMVKGAGGKNTKYDSSFFGWIKFEMLPEDADELRKEGQVLPHMLRSIVIRTVKESTFMSNIRRKPIREDADQPKDVGNITRKVVKEEKEEISEEELDKTIEELVAN